MKYTGTCQKGKLIFDNPLAFSLQKSKLDSKRFNLELKQFRNKKSNRQCSYLMGVLVKMIAEELGYLPSEIEKLWFWIKIQIGWVDDRGVPKETKDCTTIEYEEIASKVRMWASIELNMYLPLPNEAEENYL